MMMSMRMTKGLFCLTSLVLPHLQLVNELGDHQEGLPALTFLRLQDVPEDVVPDVHDVLPLGPQQVTHHVRGAWGETRGGSETRERPE